MAFAVPIEKKIVDDATRTGPPPRRKREGEPKTGSNCGFTARPAWDIASRPRLGKTRDHYLNVGERSRAAKTAWRPRARAFEPPPALRCGLPAEGDTSRSEILFHISCPEH
ncbi:jg13958 [Pararge aegeria aegeria]|uniref:Jg13958 protein n=1 Tax=Pararge aegeria aegeria TaxID=348720 RepID=A0A8S4QQQ2_9NEOP|nr:jg13958 [Pararge aegeria aegeria]